MNHLLREHAPISDDGWKRIDDEARERLSPGLAARRLVDFSGPHGWQYSSTNLGRISDIAFPAAKQDGRVHGHRRKVLALAELHAPFSVSRAELRDGDRGAEDVDFDDLAEAAGRLAAAENVAVFHGWPEADIAGIAPSSPHPVIERGEDVEAYASLVARALELMLRAGVGGPYALALSREEYTLVVQTAEHGGLLLFDHLREILGGPIVWSAGLEGALVISQRGGDFLFESGQDLSVGYYSHDADNVTLYLEESFSFRVASPEAAVAIA
jgi:uncharacterized linocin/CFP29 family protein